MFTLLNNYVARIRVYLANRKKVLLAKDRNNSKIKPGLECLETRQLLSAALPVQPMVQSSNPPVGIVETMQVSSPTIANGQTETLTFKETNHSIQPVTIMFNQNSQAFEVLDSAKDAIWISNPGNQGSTTITEVLQPGESLVETTTWIPNVANGTYTVVNQMDPNGASATINVITPTKIASSN